MMAKFYPNFNWISFGLLGCVVHEEKAQQFLNFETNWKEKGQTIANTDINTRNKDKETSFLSKNGRLFRYSTNT
jgi:hypothetical protein